MHAYRSIILAALLAAADAHVSMVYKAGQIGPIRNANAADGNGQASVSTPCGGEKNRGANGVGQAQDGDTVTLSMRYAAGHNGAFRMAFSCAGGDGSELEGNDAALTAGANGCTATGANGAYGDGDGGGATATGQDTMDITCTLPEQGNTDPADCTVGILDQRDWGGCVDITLNSAAAKMPPAPPPTPWVSSAGDYQLKNINMVDSSKGMTDVGTFVCCPLGVGALTIPDYQTLAPTVEATWSMDAVAYDCPVMAPDPAGPPPENTASYPVTLPVTMTIAGTEGSGINKYVGTTTMAGQPFEVIVSGGKLSWANSGGDQPIICDGNSELGLTPTMEGEPGFESALKPSGGAVGGIGGGTAAFALLVLGGGAYAYKMKMDKDAAAKGGAAPAAPAAMYPAAGGGPAAPAGGPPGAPPAGGLPPGWTEMTDPNSGAQYYYNQTTGESAWTRPNFV